MHNLAIKQEQHADVFQDMGAVVQIEGPVFVVRCGSVELRAKRAASCLLQPERGDFVLVAGAGSGPCYVLAVLERDEAAAGRIVVDGDLKIQLPNGRLAVAAQDGVHVASGQDVSVAAPTVKVQAVEGTIAVERTSLIGSLLQAEVQAVKVFAGTVDSLIDRVSQKVKRVYRQIEESEHVRAARIDYVAKKNMSLRGGSTLITAEELVKVDGDQIHLG